MKKTYVFGVIIITLFLVSFIYFFSDKERLPKVCFPNKCVNVEIVDTPEARNQGLMFRESLAENTGMLFIFEKSGVYSFWMKNTLIPLDMIWINSNFEVVDVKTAIPCTEDPCATYGGKTASKYVVEVNDGFVEENEIKIGDFVTIN